MQLRGAAAGSAGGAAGCGGAARPMSVLPNWNLPPSAWKACHPAQPISSPPAMPISQPMMETKSAPKKPRYQIDGRARADSDGGDPATTSISEPFEPGREARGDHWGRKTIAACRQRG